MGRKAGFRAGTVFGQNVKAGGRHVLNKIVLRASDFRLGTGISISGAYSGYGVTVSGIQVFGWTGDDSGKASTAILTPTGVPRNTKAEVNVYWASSGVVAGGAVVLDLDYRPISVRISGAVAVTGINYVASGTVTNVTTTHNVVYGNNQTSLQKTTLTIPKTDVESSAIILLNLYRDSAEAADTWVNPVQVMAVEVEFVDS